MQTRDVLITRTAQSTLIGRRPLMIIIIGTTYSSSVDIRSARPIRVVYATQDRRVITREGKKDAEVYSV